MILRNKKGIFTTCFLALSVCATAQGASPDSSIPIFTPEAGASWLPDADDFSPPPSGPGPVTFDPAHPYVPNFGGRQPTYRVADLSNPILKPQAIEPMKRANEKVLAGGIPFRARERCWPPGVPAFLAYSLVEPIFFLQTPEKITIIDRGNSEVRRVYMNVPHSAHVKPSWYGESVGRYEGDTLVVDTIGLNEKTFVDNYRTPHSSALHVVERFKMIEGGKRLEVNIRVEDPGVFTTAWTAVQRFRRGQKDPLIEAVCAENTTNFFNQDLVPLPEASKPDF